MEQNQFIMKYLVSFLLVLPVFISCNNEQENDFVIPPTAVELRMNAIVACGGDLDIEHEETGVQWATRVLLDISKKQIPVLASEVGFDESLLEQVGWCGNCAPTGDYLQVVVMPEYVEELQPLGFQELP